MSEVFLGLLGLVILLIILVVPALVGFAWEERKQYNFQKEQGYIGNWFRGSIILSSLFLLIYMLGVIIKTALNL
jgi:hypothetical protein